MNKLSIRNNDVINQDKTMIVIQIVNDIFDVMQSICRGFIKFYDNDLKKIDNEKMLWIKAFMLKEIYSMDRVKYGMDKLLITDSHNPPQLGVFLKWCTPTEEDLGLINKKEVFEMAIRVNRQFEADPAFLSKNQLKVIKEAIKKTGTYNLRTKPTKIIKPIFLANYTLSIDEFIHEDSTKIDENIPKLESNSPHFLPDSDKSLEETQIFLLTKNN